MAVGDNNTLKFWAATIIRNILSIQFTGNSLGFIWSMKLCIQYHQYSYYRFPNAIITTCRYTCILSYTALMGTRYIPKFVLHLIILTFYPTDLGLQEFFSSFSYFGFSLICLHITSVIHVKLNFATSKPDHFAMDILQSLDNSIQRITQIWEFYIQQIRPSRI